MADVDSGDLDVALSHLPPHEKAKRAGSFGAVAAHYERFRPGPPVAAIDWLLPDRVGTVVDLGAGTGALTRLLVGKSEQVVAVEPDDRMRAVLREVVPAAQAVVGRGEAIPLPDHCADAVLASSSWHWMDLLPTLREVDRVLVPGGILGAVWSGPDPEGPFVTRARSLLAERSTGGDYRVGAARPAKAVDDGESADLVVPDAGRRPLNLEIPHGVPLSPPEHELFTWQVALNAEELIGLLGTFSWMITMPEATRARVVAQAHRLLQEQLGLEGDATVDVEFRADAWRSRTLMESERAGAHCRRG